MATVDDLSNATAAARAANEAEENERPQREPKRGRGRPRKDGKPPGSVKDEKKADAGEPKKAPVEFPPELIPLVALAPLALAAQGMARAAGVSAELIAPSPASQKAIATAFEAWLKSIEFNLTPGYALLIAYSMGISEMGMISFSLAQQRKAEEAKKKAQEPKPDDGGGSSSSGVDQGTPMVSDTLPPEGANGAAGHHPTASA